MHQPIIVAHRGNTQGNHPLPPAENTIAAFDAAIETGADMVEFDVRCTQDGVPIIHHDAEVADTPLSRLNFCTIQSSHPLIPSLESALLNCKHRIRLDLELKETGYEATVINLVQQHYPIAKFVITSFQPQVLAQIRKLQPAITIGLLLKPLSNINQPSAQAIESLIRDLKPDFLGAHHSLIDSSWLNRVNTQKLPYWVWTVNDTHQIQKFSANPKIQAIITDHCDKVVSK